MVRLWAGDGLFGPPSNIKKTHRSDKRQTAFDRSFKRLQLLHKTFSGQVKIEFTRIKCVKISYLLGWVIFAIYFLKIAPRAISDGMSPSDHKLSQKNWF